MFYAAALSPSDHLQLQEQRQQRLQEIDNNYQKENGPSRRKTSLVASSMLSSVPSKRENKPRCFINRTTGDPFSAIIRTSHKSPSLETLQKVLRLPEGASKEQTNGLTIKDFSKRSYTLIVSNGLRLLQDQKTDAIIARDCLPLGTFSVTSYLNYYPLPQDTKTLQKIIDLLNTIPLVKNPTSN